jgi:hypothetical protein
MPSGGLWLPSNYFQGALIRELKALDFRSCFDFKKTDHFAHILQCKAPAKTDIFNA